MYGLPWEVCRAVWKSETTALATVGKLLGKQAEAVVRPTEKSRILHRNEPVGRTLDRCRAEASTAYYLSLL